MAQPLGYSFAPTFSNADLGRQGGSPPASPQQALQVLNFSLGPRVAGAPGGLSPLQGQQQAGSSISQAVLASVLRTVLGAGEDLGVASGSMPGASGRDPGFDPSRLQGREPRSPVIHPGGEGGGVREPDQAREPVERGPIFGTPGLTPRGAEDPSHEGLQAFLGAERSRVRPAYESMPGTTTPWWRG